MSRDALAARGVETARMRGRPPIPRSWRALLVLALAATPAYASGELEIMPDWPKLGLLLGVFVVLVPLANALLFRPLLAVLDEREQRISGVRARAQIVAREAEEILGRYRDAVRETQATAEVSRKESVARARAQQQQQIAAERQAAEAEVEQARSDVSVALGAARAQLRSSAEGLAREAAERILGRALA
jgi:F-type H+-transporting ATPase subunit b